LEGFPGPRIEDFDDLVSITEVLDLEGRLHPAAQEYRIDTVFLQELLGKDTRDLKVLLVAIRVVPDPS
jgi:hypothetical protein